jgi:hypothetical protein
MKFGSILSQQATRNQTRADKIKKPISWNPKTKRRVLHEDFFMILPLNKPYYFFLFSSNLLLSLQAEQAGIFSVIVDWENLGKNDRQNGHKFEINQDRPEDVKLLTGNLRIPVTVRVNSLGQHTRDEVDLALSLGARILMLPMATAPSEVAEFLRIVKKRAGTVIQIETWDLAKRAQELINLEWDFAHIGLNDLSISLNNKWIWEALYDGTIERICTALKGRNYGFGGATIVGGGSPIPFVHLLNEMLRLKCRMAILRRTFKREIQNLDMDKEMKTLYEAVRQSNFRSWESVDEDKQTLNKILSDLRPRC